MTHCTVARSVPSAARNLGNATKHRTVDERHRRRDNAGGENDSTPSDRQLTAKLTGARFGIYDPARARVDEWLRHTAPLKNIERPAHFVVGRSSVDDGRPS